MLTIYYLKELTKMELEFVYYEKVVRYNVNSYLAIKHGFKDLVSELDKDIEERAEKGVQTRGCLHKYYYCDGQP